MWKDTRNIGTTLTLSLQMAGAISSLWISTSRSYFTGFKISNMLSSQRTMHVQELL